MHQAFFAVSVSPSLSLSGWPHLTAIHTCVVAHLKFRLHFISSELSRCFGLPR